MASQDVIELGSSDDEPEPAQKKVKPKKPPLNAMVHIPTNLPGVTIKKSKHNGQSSKPQQLPKVVKIGPKISNRPISIPVLQTIQVKPAINPLKFMQTINNSQVQIKKLQPTNIPLAVAMKRTGKPSPKIAHNVVKINTCPKAPCSVLKTPVAFGSKGIGNLNHIVQATNILKKICSSNPQPQSSKTLSHVPPGITIKQVKHINNATQVKHMKNATQAVAKRPLIRPAILPAPKKPKPNPPRTVGEVLTVELDDDDSSVSTNSPQWYMRPEDQGPDKSLEEKNNKEPETQTFIEITIEDSPIKPAPSKRRKEVADEASINIDDSPVKGPEKDKLNEEKSGSDEDTSAQPSGTPNSKKKLQYIKEVVNDTKDEATASTEGSSSAPSSIEIEIPALEVEVAQIAENFETIEAHPDANDIVIEIVESPAKKRKICHAIKDTKNPVLDETTVPNKTAEPATEALQSATEKIEFHPTYQSFIDLCFKLENSDDMKKIVEKKIKTYYLQVPKEYTESEEFLEMVSSKIMSMKAGPEKMYLYIKDIVDELNLQRRMAKAKAVENEKEQEKAAIEFYGEELEADTKRKRQVRKLEKTLKKLNRAIHKLEEQEVDFDDDGDSVYILTERYKERLVRVHAKLCQLSNTKMPSEPRVHIEQRPGKPAGPAQRLEKWINKRVPVGTPLPFPDFHDVLRFVREANEEDKLGWNEVDIMEEARDLFTRCGKKLQRRRQENEWRLAASRLPPDADPAETSHDLKRKLEENRNISSQKEAELINKFADKQKQLQLEAVEINDKEAEESPVESGDEVQEEQRREEETLESTESRKERLHRLLKERSKGATKNSNPIELDDDEDDVAIQENSENTVSKSPEEGKENDDTSNKLTICEETCAAVGDPSDTIEANVPGDSLNRSGENIDIHSLSDDSKDDGDELSLLQKLHSGTDIATSTLDSSDVDSPINISDTLGSSDDVQKKGNKNFSDVVSIENSSYSDPEEIEQDPNINEDPNIEDDVIFDATEGNTEDPLEEMNENEDKNSPKKKQNSNDEYTEPLEDILLASSDDEDADKEKESQVKAIDVDIDESFVNLKDDSISIGDTIIEGSAEPNSGSSVDKPIQPEDGETDKVRANTNCDHVDEASSEKVYESGKNTRQIGDDLLEQAKPKDGAEASEVLKDGLSDASNGGNMIEDHHETKDNGHIAKAVEQQDEETVASIESEENIYALETNEANEGSIESNHDSTIALLSNLIDEKVQGEVESEPSEADLVKSVKPITSKEDEVTVNSQGDEGIEKHGEPNIDIITDKSAPSEADLVKSVKPITSKEDEVTVNSQGDEGIEKHGEPNIDIITDKSAPSEADLVKSVKPITSKEDEVTVNSQGDEGIEKHGEPNIDIITDKSENAFKPLHDSGNCEKVANIIMSMDTESVTADNCDIPHTDFKDQMPMANEGELKSMDVDRDDNTEETTSEKKEDNEAMDTAYIKSNN